ncbi:unnamed protein product [Closterium sp. NIES-65]|nr:unnamed protein product [Closterium sp. NIES-65]
MTDRRTEHVRIRLPRRHRLRVKISFTTAQQDVLTGVPRRCSASEEWDPPSDASREDEDEDTREDGWIVRKQTGCKCSAWREDARRQ